MRTTSEITSIYLVKSIEDVQLFRELLEMRAELGYSSIKMLYNKYPMLTKLHDCLRDEFRMAKTDE